MSCAFFFSPPRNIYLKKYFIEHLIFVLLSCKYLVQSMDKFCCRRPPLDPLYFYNILSNITTCTKSWWAKLKLSKIQSVQIVLLTIFERIYGTDQQQKEIPLHETCFEDDKCINFYMQIYLCKCK